MDAAAQLAYRPDIGVSIAGVLPKRVETTREQPAARRKCVTCFKCFRQAGRRGHAGPSVTIAASVSAASRRAGSPDVALCPMRVAHVRWQRGNEPSAPPRGTSSAILISNATPSRWALFRLSGCPCAAAYQEQDQDQDQVARRTGQRLYPHPSRPASRGDCGATPSASTVPFASWRSGYGQQE
jgi:hypothetical protein